MWQRIYALIVKELLASARDPQTRWVVLFSPPFLLLIYAFAITQEVSDVTLAVYNQVLWTRRTGAVACSRSSRS